jgi:chemotaxis-related protein WspD
MSEPVAQCWRKIGVYGGDHSCPQLKSDIHCRNCVVFRDAARGLLLREADPLPPLSTALGGRSSEGSRSVLAFRLGREWLGLRCERVAEVAEARVPRRIAHRGNGRLEGLVPVRGELHLCVALIEVLQLGQRHELAGDRARLVLLAPANAAPIAFRASEVAGLRSVLAHEIEEVPATLPPALARCLSGVVAGDQGRMALLDESALLTALEEALYS